ncbi:unnamed protein product [Gongylonema pulchrum]|uniref:Uncharacterized protein n=1 Tax=Gongylonema pulchrum TaxID=637853 RepID=A0A183EGF3_9BILA|nr:unnamed protein product [Gongylonema pulchrum]
MSSAIKANTQTSAAQKIELDEAFVRSPGSLSFSDEDDSSYEGADDSAFFFLNIFRITEDLFVLDEDVVPESETGKLDERFTEFCVDGSLRTESDDLIVTLCLCDGQNSVCGDARFQPLAEDASLAHEFSRYLRA